MATPQLTAREYAYIRITGPGTHELITERLGTKPTDAWNTGDLNERNGRPYKFMAWHLRSGLDDTHPLEQHVAELFLRFHAEPEAARALWVDYDFIIQCVGYYPHSQGPGAHFNREIIRAAARYGFSIDCDFYFTEDHGHDN